MRLKVSRRTKRLVVAVVAAIVATHVGIDVSFLMPFI